MTASEMSVAANKSEFEAPRWIEGAAFEEFWERIWKSDTARAWAHGADPQAAWLKERLSERPFFLCEPWEPELQRRHFSQMWGQVFTRAYKNPALEDLYWIHELTHWATVDLKPAPDFQAWRAKWDLNELRASCASEILAHGPMPGILGEALGTVAWAARFGELGGANPEDRSTWTQASREAFDRRLAIRDGVEQPSCEDEKWFSGFKEANEKWGQLWKDDWPKLDERLAAYEGALKAGDRLGARQALARAGLVDEFPAIPYAAQAHAFLEIDGAKRAPEIDPSLKSKRRPKP
jgi:hypothetical protein